MTLLKLLLIKLKVLAVLCLLALPCLFMFSFNSSREFAEEIWSKLGMTKTEGTDGVKQSFLNGYLYYYGAKNAKNIALNNRAAIAKDLMAYTKQYISSTQFKKEYDALRADAKPSEPTRKARTKEEIRKEKIAETEKSLRESEKIVKEMGADMAKVMQPTIDMLRKNLTEYKEPDNKHIEMYYQGELRDVETEIRNYKERLAKWEKDYPASHLEIVKARLKRFLELSATVDFSAELKQVGKMKKFVNPEYEGKSYDWKQIYRAGKDVIEPARAFAEKWLAELK